MKYLDPRFAAALTSFICLTPTSDAQQLHEQIREGSAAVICRSGSTASHIKENCDYLRRTEAISREIEITTTIRSSVDNSRACNALLDMQYHQRSTVAHVQGLLTNEDCAASSGRYTITATIRNAEDEIETLDFEEQWQRIDDQPIIVEADYPIGEDAELLQLGARRVMCRCETEVLEPNSLEGTNTNATREASGADQTLPVIR